MRIFPLLRNKITELTLNVKEGSFSLAEWVFFCRIIGNVKKCFVFHPEVSLWRDSSLDLQLLFMCLSLLCLCLTGSETLISSLNQFTTVRVVSSTRFDVYLGMPVGRLFPQLENRTFLASRNITACGRYYWDIALYSNSLQAITADLSKEMRKLR